VKYYWLKKALLEEYRYGGAGSLEASSLFRQ